MSISYDFLCFQSCIEMKTAQEKIFSTTDNFLLNQVFVYHEIVHTIVVLGKLSHVGRFFFKKTKFEANFASDVVHPFLTKE